MQPDRPRKDDCPAVGAGQIATQSMRGLNMRTVPPPPARSLIRRLRFEIVLLAVSGVAVVAFAAWWTVFTAADPRPGSAAVAMVAMFAVMATLAGIGAIAGIGGCRDDIRRARR